MEEQDHTDDRDAAERCERMGDGDWVESGD